MSCILEIHPDHVEAKYGDILHHLENLGGARLDVVWRDYRNQLVVSAASIGRHFLSGI